MALSIHDNLLVSYEVQCEARTIMLHAEYRVENEPTQFTNVVFKGVQGYHFEMMHLETLSRVWNSYPSNSS